LSASLRTGTTMETAMAAMSEEGKSHPLTLAGGQPVARFLWG
jgi:hypothetical protein